MNANTTWTYEQYWNAVLGANRSADDIVREFDLDGANEGSVVRRWET